jgi:hypothetical protein
MSSSASEPSADSSQTLSDSIAAATRCVHAHLNKQIIARLPLAIPPYAPNPSLYTTGLLHITPIYLAFESLWSRVAKAPATACNAMTCMRKDASKTSSEPAGHQSACCSITQEKQLPLIDDRIHGILSSLYIQDLLRSDRLRNDIRLLTGWTDDVIEQQLQKACESSRLGEFVDHINRTIAKKPHVLLAYSYVLFMALFAGGRFIRATLESAGDLFWDHGTNPVKPAMLECWQQNNGTCDLPLGFFYFPTPIDGGDLKKEFKRRFLESGQLLTLRERHDIIQEAVCIFDNMVLLVSQLDRVCAVDHESIEQGGSPKLAQLYSTLLSGRLRDSVAVAKERSAKTAARNSTSSEDSATTHACVGRSEGETKSTLELQFAKTIQGESVPAAGKSDYTIQNRPEESCCISPSKLVRFEKDLAVPKRKKAPAKMVPTDGSFDTHSTATSERTTVPPLGQKISRAFLTMVSNILLLVALASLFSPLLLKRGPLDITEHAA